MSTYTEGEEALVFSSCHCPLLQHHLGLLQSRWPLFIEEASACSLAFSASASSVRLLQDVPVLQVVCICRLLRRILLAASTVVTAGAPGTATADKVPRGVCTPQSSSSRPLSASDSPVATSGSWPVSAAGSSIPPSAVASELPSALRSAFLRPSVFSQEDLHLVVAGVSALVSQQSSGGRSGKASEALQAATDLLATVSYRQEAEVENSRNEEDARAAESGEEPEKGTTH